MEDSLGMGIRREENRSVHGKVWAFGFAEAILNSFRLKGIVHSLPSARHMYKNAGFSYRGSRYLFAENTTWTDFFFYEIILRSERATQ